jgi:hypothetical protein
MDLKLWVSAGKETSAHTGRIFKVFGFFDARDIFFLGKSVYAIHATAKGDRLPTAA